MMEGDQGDLEGEQRITAHLMIHQPDQTGHQPWTAAVGPFWTLGKLEVPKYPYGRALEDSSSFRSARYRDAIQNPLIATRSRAVTTGRVLFVLTL